MASLDVSYFTSLSFYILLLFGLRGVLSLIFAGDIIDDSAVMQQQMPGSSATFDAKNEFKGEKQRFDLVWLCHILPWPYTTCAYDCASSVCLCCLGAHAVN